MSNPLKPDPPAVPDPTKTANTQAQYGTQTAQNNINMNSQNNNGVFGSGTVTKDANGNVTGQTSSLDPTLQGGANSTASAFSSQAGLLPTSPINWDNTSANTIANNTINAYQKSVAPQRAQAQNTLDTTLSDRGIPIGSQVYNDAQGNLDNANSIGDANAISAAWNAVPGNQATMTNTQIAQNNQPIATAQGTLGLLQGLDGLAPTAQIGSSNAAAPDYTGAVNTNFNDQTAQYNSQMQGLGSLAGAGLGLLTAPLTGGLTGGLSNSLAGKAVTGLFN